MVDFGLKRDPHELGCQLAERIVHSITNQDAEPEQALSSAATHIAFRANSLIAQRLPPEEVREWAEKVEAAFGDRLSYVLNVMIQKRVCSLRFAHLHVDHRWRRRRDRHC